MPLPLAALAYPFALTVGRYLLAHGARATFQKYGPKTVQAALKNPKVKQYVKDRAQSIGKMAREDAKVGRTRLRKDPYKERRGQLELQKPGDPQDIGKVTGPRDLLNPPRFDRPLEFQMGGIVGLGGMNPIKYSKALGEFAKKGNPITKAVSDNIRAYIEANPNEPYYNAALRVQRGWTAEPEKKKEIDRINKFAKESEAAQAQQRSDQIQKERDAREEEDRLKTEAIRTAATRPTPVAPVMPEAPKTVEEIIAQITETEPGMDPVQEAVNKAVGIAPTPQPVLPTPQPTPDLPPVTPPTVAPVMPTMTGVEPGMDTTVGPPGTTIDPIQEAVNKATGVSLPMPAAQVVPESISKVTPQPTFPVETEPGMTTPNTGIMAPVTQPVQATTMPRPVEPEIREVVKPPAPPPLPTMLPTETEPTTGVDYNTGIMQPVQTAPVTPPVTTAPPAADLTQNIAEPAVPVDPVQESVDAAVGDSDMEGYISYSGKDEGGWYTVGPKGKTYLPKFPTADPVQDAVDAAVGGGIDDMPIGAAVMTPYYNPATGETTWTGNTAETPPEGFIPVPEGGIPQTDPVQEAVDAAVGGGTPPVVEEEVVTEETPVDQGPSEIDKLRELIAQLQAQQAEQQTAQQAAAQQRAAQEAEMAQNYTLTGPSIGYNPYVSGQYQSDPYGAAGVPDFGGITTIPVPAPWQPPTLQPWQAPAPPAQALASWLEPMAQEAQTSDTWRQ